MTLRKIIITASFGTLGATVAAAQEPAPVAARTFLRRAPDGMPPDVMLLGGHASFEREVVKGAPFSADTTTEIVQTLADGNRLVRKTNGRIARDSEGRVRREQTLAAIGGLLAGPEPPRVVSIHDPVGQFVYFVHDDDRRVLRVARDGQPGAERPRDILFHRRVEGPAALPEPKSESLGSREIEGLRTEGTRQTFVLPAGHIGNEKPIEVVSEQWRSPELEVMVQTRHQDPRFGTTEYHLENVQRSEPEASLFQVPAGYAVEDGPQGRFHLRRQRER